MEKWINNDKIKRKFIWWNSFFIIFILLFFSFFILAVVGVTSYAINKGWIGNNDIFMQIGQYGIVGAGICGGICSSKKEKSKTLWKELKDLENKNKTKKDRKYKRVLEWKNE